MKLIRVPLNEAQGGILAHSQKTKTKRFAKGTKLDNKILSQLQSAGLETITIASLDDNDILENQAASQLAQSLSGINLHIMPAVSGRVNLFAKTDGILVYEPERLQSINRITPEIAIATHPKFKRIKRGEIVATIKVIPFAVAPTLLQQIEQRALVLSIYPFKKKKIVLIQTQLPSLSNHVLNKTTKITQQRLASIGNSLLGEWRCGHDKASVLKTLTEIKQADLYLIVGASAICDAKDEIPVAITAAGGTIERVGMPVDPGNLFVLARLAHVPCLILPGCARSIKQNGFDFVLERLCADINVSGDDIAQMGERGILQKQTISIPSPPSIRIGGILLAAGQSIRSKNKNKLLTSWKGQPLLLHAATTLMKAQTLFQKNIVVCGHEQEAICNLLVQTGFTTCYNPNYKTGIASSLICGLDAFENENLDAVLFMLGDMPHVSLGDISALIEAFPFADNEIVVPVHQGKRGNPVLIGKRHFSTLRNLKGDVGARSILHLATEVKASSGVLYDIDEI